MHILKEYVQLREKSDRLIVERLINGIKGSLIQKAPTKNIYMPLVSVTHFIAKRHHIADRAFDAVKKSPFAYIYHFQILFQLKFFYSFRNKWSTIISSCYSRPVPVQCTMASKAGLHKRALQIYITSFIPFDHFILFSNRRFSVSQ